MPLRNNAKSKIEELQKRLLALEAETHYLRESQKLWVEEQLRNKSLTQRDRLLIASAISVRALLTAENIHDAIDLALRTIGEVLETDRASVVEFLYLDSDSQLPRWRVLHEWHVPGAPSQLAEPMEAEGTHEGAEAFLAMLAQGESISVLFEELGEPFCNQQVVLDIKAIHSVPILVEGQLWGALDFDDCYVGKPRNIGELSLLRVAADCIGSAITQQRVQQSLKQTEQARAYEKTCVTELTKANILLQNSLSRLSTEPDLTSALGQLLVELVQYAGAAVGHIFIHDERQDTLNLVVRCRDGQPFWESAVDEPLLFQSPIPVELTPVFTELCCQLKLAILNEQDFEGRMWPGVLEWLQAEGYRGTCSCVLMVGDRPLGMLAMSFTQPVDFQSVKEGLILALTQQIALVIQLTQLSKADKQRAIAHEREIAAQERAAELQSVNAELQQSKYRLQDLIDTMSDCAWEVDATLTYTFIDKKICRILGYRPEEMLGKTPFEFMATEAAEQALTTISCIVAKQEPFSRLEKLHLSKDGRVVIFETSGTPIFDANNEFLGYRGVCNDVTQLRWMQDTLLQAEQKKAEELAKANRVLKRSLDALAADLDLKQFIGQMLRTTAEQLEAPVVEYWSQSDSVPCLKLSCWQGHVLGPEQLADQCHNQIMTVPLGLNAHSLQEQQRYSIIDDILNDLDYIRLYAALGCDLESWCKEHNVGQELNIPLRLGKNTIGNLCIYIPAERLFTDQKIELAQALAHQITLAVQMTRLVKEAKQAATLDERNRMAQEVHDTLAQAFTGVLMQLEATKRKISSAQLPAAQEHIARARGLAQTGLSEARRSVRALRPEPLESNDLPNALYHLAQQMTDDTAVQIRVEIHGTSRPLKINTENNLLRIAQEALTNALRHAAPQIVQLQLRFTPSIVQLCIDDDGIGFNPQSKITASFGLIGMQERSRSIGGEFNLTSQAGQGTKIAVTVPLLGNSDG